MRRFQLTAPCEALKLAVNVQATRGVQDWIQLRALTAK